MAEQRDLPFVVMVASFFGFAYALFLGFMGLVGVASWDEVSDPWGYGALVAGGLFGVASLLLLRGSGVARALLAVLAGLVGLLALYYVFTGPTSAIVPSLVTLSASLILVWLLYGVKAAQRYFAG